MPKFIEEIQEKQLIPKKEFSHFELLRYLFEEGYRQLNRGYRADLLDCRADMYSFYLVDTEKVSGIRILINDFMHVVLGRKSKTSVLGQFKKFENAFVEKCFRAASDIPSKPCFIFEIYGKSNKWRVMRLMRKLEKKFDIFILCKLVSNKMEYVRE